jgi:hypothetical protein
VKIVKRNQVTGARRPGRETDRGQPNRPPHQVESCGRRPGRQPDRRPGAYPPVLHPRTDLILRAPIGFRLHALSAWALFAFWPFSRLVHVFSAPLGYLTRPYIVYRSRDVQLGTRVP